MNKTKHHWDPLKRKYVSTQQLDKINYQYELRFLWLNRDHNNEDINEPRRHFHTRVFI
jgi:hypothetical protein